MFRKFTFIENNPCFKELWQIKKDAKDYNRENIIEDPPIDSSGLCKISVGVRMTNSTISEINPKILV